MAFTYDVNAVHKDKHSSWCLLICHMLITIINMFISTFFVAHIYTLSGDIFEYVKNVGIYYLIAYIVFAISYCAFSYIVDRTKRIGVFRLSVFFRMSVVIVMIFFGQNLATILPLSGFLYGFSGGAYYSSYNVLKQEMVSKRSMGDFATYATMLAKAIEIIAPIGLGAIISVSSFVDAAIYVAIITFAIFIVSFFIKAQKPEGSSFNLKGYLKVLKSNDESVKKIKYLYGTAFVYGFSTATEALISLCIMMQFGSSLSLGSITSIINAVVLIEIFVVNKFTKPGKRSYIYLISMFLPIIGTLLFTLIPSMTTVVIFKFLLAISLIIAMTEYDIYRNSNLKEAGLYNYIAEHQVVVEECFCASRISGFTLILLIGLMKSIIAFKILLVVLSLTYSLLLLLLKIYESKHLKKVA